jgi:uncharacterized protein YbcV (DUF1398 family)
MDIKVAEECSRLSAEEKITFGEVVGRLDKAGIESYIANMLVPNKIYYAGNEAHEVPLNLKIERKVAATFNRDNVVQAIRTIQANKIGYQEFLKRIMDAGVIFYIVFIKGRKAIYFGRNGEHYIEEFPSKS